MDMATTAACLCGRQLSGQVEGSCRCGRRLGSRAAAPDEPVSHLTAGEQAIFGALQARLALLEDRLMRRIDERLEALRVAIDQALVEADVADDDDEDENPEDEEE
jgi:hypothetical protein